MAKIDKITVDNTEYDIVSGDNLPVGTEVEVEDGTTIPTGWQEVSNNGWSTLATQVLANTQVTLPSSFSELFAEIAVGDNSSTSLENIIPFYIPKIAITNELKIYRLGNYFLSNFNTGVLLALEGNKIWFNDALRNSTVVSANSRMNVYYK